MDLKDKLILGTVQFGLDYGINNSIGKIKEFSVYDILDYAHTQEISILDTADAYGNAVNLIGNYHANRNHTFEIITKFSLEDKQVVDIENLVKNSISKLKIKNIFGYLYHSFADFKNYPDVYEQLKKIKNKGLIKHIGISIYTNEQFEEVLTEKSIEIIQLPYNLLDNNNQRGKLIERAKELGKIIHVRSVFLQGLFFKDLNNLPKVLEPLKPALITISEIARNYEMSTSQLALSYVFSNPFLDGVLMGVDNVKQLKMNIKVIKQPILEEVKAKIDDIFVADINLLNPSNWV